MIVTKLVILAMMISFLVLVKLNPFGLGQIIIWGMRPPYRWVVSKTYFAQYLDSRNESCATIYKEYDSPTLVVFGLGFNLRTTDLIEAKRKAERECR